jgi:hypothetical protein
VSVAKLFASCPHRSGHICSFTPHENQTQPKTTRRIVQNERAELKKTTMKPTADTLITDHWRILNGRDRYGLDGLPQKRVSGRPKPE